MAGSDKQMIAGKDFPWEWIQDYYLLVDHVTQFAEIEGDKVGQSVLGAYGMATVELPNPDVSDEQPQVSLPIENKDDYKTLTRAFIDEGVRSGENEVVEVYHRSKGFLGRPKPSIYAAIYKAGVWRGFYEAVKAYDPQGYKWPEPLIQFLPGDLGVFPGSPNTIRV